MLRQSIRLECNSIEITIDDSLAILSGLRMAEKPVILK